ncbi:MAG: L,D-transpeptidase family protein [Anaerolineaceae bacterium]|nr:L,D-transpeptidase family protein [Anaerolineaceae bacterium]
MADKRISALRLLEQAKQALKENDIQTARKLAQQSISSDPNCLEAWLLLADLSRGTAQKAYLKEASVLSGISPPKDTNNSPRSISSNSIHAPPGKRPALFLTLVISILLITSLVVFLVWVVIPTQSSVSAIDHSAQRIAGDLPKPSLTSTKTNTPTQTPTPSITPEPAHTPTSEPTSAAPPQLVDTYPPPEIPIIITEDIRWIDINLTTQRTYAYEGVDLIRTFIVSTGTIYHPTVAGQFYIYVKYRFDDMSGPGYYLPDVPYTMYFYKGYGIHGTYWHNNFGVPMSHGCINMTIADSMWLYSWASVGTLVNIHY